MMTATNVTSIVPALQISNAIDRVKIPMSIVRQLKDTALVDGMDYGVIPGTGDKPTLLLPGMEKLMRALNAVPEYIEKRVIVDYDKPLFHYEYECRLIDAETGLAIPGGRGLGLCTSYESAFRWRKAERTCPECGQTAIIKGKDEYGGGWLCFKKKGGCGAKFPDGSAIIETQEAGRIENPDIFDQVNAIMKRGKKRALGDAIKGAANISEFFTVDLEDLPQHSFVAPDDDIVDTTFTEVVNDKPAAPKKQNTPAATSAWKFADKSVDDLMFETREWTYNGAEKMNTIKALRTEGAFDGCKSLNDAIAVLKARLESPEHGKKKITLDMPPDDDAPEQEAQS
jgi:hypothetical protein